MGTLYIFDHIYKTAGTTFSLAYLPGAFEPEKIFVLRGMRDTNEEDLKKLRTFSEDQLQPLRVIAGHNAGQLRGALSREARFLTVVRNPAARGISGYLHARLHGDAFEVVGREIQEQNIGISEFIERDLFARRYADFVSLHEGQARVLLGAENLSNVPRTDEEITETIRSRYELVGYTEAFEMFLFMLHVTENFPLALFSNRLVRPESRSWRVTDADLETIERHSRLDQQVYDCVRKEFDRKVSAIWAPSLARQYDEYVTALKEFQKEANRTNFLGSVHFPQDRSVSSRNSRPSPIPTNEDLPLSTFSPARAYWNQRVTLSNERERILALSQAVDQRSDLAPYQWAQLMAAAIDFAPDLILELGRGKGNSTCAFTEASNLNGGRSRILSLCLSDNWERETLPRLGKIVPGGWFQPVQALRADILEFDYQKALSGAKRVLIFWDAHGFDIAECVLGKILPIVSRLEHLVIMHDLSDTRYSSDEQFDYGGHGLWKGNNWSGPRLKLGIIDSAVEQSIAALDFTTRNHITLDSADHSFHTDLTSAQQQEMRSVLGELFETQGHWFYFSLNEKPGPYKFPHYAAHVGKFQF